MGVWEYEQLDDVTNQLWVPHVSGQIDFVQACTVKARRFKITFCMSIEKPPLSLSHCDGIILV